MLQLKFLMMKQLSDSFNISKNGVTGFSLHEDHGLTPEEVKQVFQTAIDDCSEVLK
ncbi:hypothetical protein [Bacteroides faecis]|uniref:hypothetical protein n=1 Tax=Bacteroides faecis TaxID=674529 RepID=UPI00286E5694|nr:hypothetical protein [Bacteroides faecis]MCS3125024.1 hypothetical protein [Bacteroides faecis]